ncbi:MAG TPA: secretin N-terminal domain-containing protein [Verrucomicrobiae bacterium]
MKKNLPLTAICLGAVALNLTAQTPPAPGGPPAPGSTNMIRRPSRTPQTPAAPGSPVAPQAQTPPAPQAPPALPAVPPAPSSPAAPAPAPGMVQAVTPGANQPLPNVAAQVAPGSGAVNAAGEQLIPIEDLRFPQMELSQFIKFYAEQVGRTIIQGTAIAPLLKATVSLEIQTPLTKSELLQAMDTVLAQNGVVILPMGEKLAVAVPEAMAFQQGTRFKTAGDMIVEAQSYETRIVTLTNALPSEMQQVLTPFSKVPNGIIPIDGTRKLILRDYSVNIARMVEIIKELDVNIPMEVELELIPIKYALSADMASVLGSLTSGGSVGSTGARTTGTTGRSGTTSRLSGANSRTGGSLGVGNTGGFGGQQGGVNTLQNRPGTTGNVAGNQANFQNQLANIVNRAASGGSLPILGDAKIIPDERTNALLVFGTKEERDMIKKIIKELDVVQQQVLIEAVIMEVSLSDSFNFGVSAANATSFDKGAKRLFGGSKFTDFGSLTNFPGGLDNGFSYFGQMGSWDLAVSATAGDGSINVLSRPRIQTSHAVEASLFVGQTVPFITGTTSDINGGARSQFQNQPVGINLSVLPLINQDGLVVLDIDQQVAQLGENREIDGNLVPTTTERNATARVAVKNGETVILGGFISSNKRKSKTGVPFLKDIPVLGALFSQKSDNNDRVELIVLIRPTVLKTPEIASSVAESERQRLSGVRKAEMDILNEESKLAEKSEKEMEKMKKSRKPVVKDEMLLPGNPLQPTPVPADPNAVPATPPASKQ